MPSQKEHHIHRERTEIVYEEIDALGIFLRFPSCSFRFVFMDKEKILYVEGERRENRGKGKEYSLSN